MTVTAHLVDLVVRAANETGDGHGGHDHGQDHAHGNEQGNATTAAEAGAGAGYCSGTVCMRNWKIAFAVLLFVEGVVFGYVPLLLKRFACLSTKRFRRLLSFVNVGGGGIFLATGMLHILPEALELLREPESHGAHGSEVAGKQADLQGHGTEHGHEHGFPVGPAVILYTFILFLFLEKVLFPHSHGAADVKSESEAHNHEWTSAPTEENNDMEPKRDGILSKTFFTYVLITLFIGLHSVFESVALGSSKRWGTVLNLFIAISTHRWATTMTLGARYERASLSPLAYSLLVIGYAAIAPLGIAIGVGVREASRTVVGVVFALSAGIFVYVGAFETPAEEFVERKDLRYPKFAVYTLGAGIITIITGILFATGAAAH